MIKLQNNFTTLEQSKKLLELGVPTDSADCWICIDKSDSTYKIKVFHSHNYSYIENYYNEMNRKEEMYIDILPCWSVGRLIEIYLLCAELKKPQMIFIKEDVLMMDRMINELCRMAESERLDFSKLEE